MAKAESKLRLLFCASILALSPGVDAACNAAGEWQDPRAQRLLEEQAVITRASAASVVLLGERHDAAAHHRWQLRILQALHAQRGDFVLGFEMFPRRVQPQLDRWNAGELNEAEFVAAVDWPKIWGTDAQFYLPLLRYARDNGIKVVALNVEHALARRVAKEGWENVPAAIREGVTQPAAASPAYIATLQEAYAQHGRNTPLPEDPAFKRFVEAQQLWDRAMAQAIAAQSPKRVVAIIGSGHLRDGHGVPHQLRDLGLNDVLTLLPWDTDDCENYGSDVADAVYGIGKND